MLRGPEEEPHPAHELTVVAVRRPNSAEVLGLATKDPPATGCQAGLAHAASLLVVGVVAAQGLPSSASRPQDLVQAVQHVRTMAVVYWLPGTTALPCLEKKRVPIAVPPPKGLLCLTPAST